MPAEERRTLSIQARVKDFASPSLRTMGRGVTRFADLATRDFRRVTAGIRKFQGVFATVVGFLSVRSGVSAFRGIANDLDEIAKNSERLELTTGSIQSLSFAAKLGGTSFEQLASGLSQFSRNLDLARRGSREQLSALNDLGIRLEALPLGPSGKLDVIALLEDLAVAYDSLEDRTRAAAAIQILFGESGRFISPLLTDNAVGLRETAQQYERLAGVISPEDLQRAEEFNNSVVRLQTSFQGLGRRVFLEFAPGLTQFLNDAADDVADLRVKVSREVGVFAQDTLRFVQSATAGLEPLLIFLGTRLDLVIAQVAAVVALYQSAALAINLARGLVPGGEFESAKSSLAELSASLDQAKAAVDRLVSFEGEIGLADKIKEQIDKIQDLLLNLPGVKDAAGDAGKSAGAAFGSGFLQQAKEAFGQFTDLTVLARESAQSLVRGGLDRFAGALTSIITRTKSAREAFAEFGRATLQTLTQLLVKLLLIKGLSLIPGVGGLVGGGLFERGGIARGDVKKTIPIRQYQRGGIARGPQIAVFGEGSARRGEAFVPLPDGRNIPVVLSGGGGSTFNFYIQAMDGQDVHRVLVRNRASIMSIWSHQVSHRNNVRQTLRRAAS